MDRDSSSASVKLGVISAGPTRQLDQLRTVLPSLISLREDLGPSDLPDDFGLFDCLALVHAAAPAPNAKRPPTAFVLGAAQHRGLFLAGLRRLLDLDVDLIAFWTCSPLNLPGPPDGDDAFDALLAEIVAREIALVCPAGTGLGRRCPGLFTASGVIATAPFLDLCPIPSGWPNEPALVAGWGDSASFRTSWINSGIGTLPPPAFPAAAGHTLAVWSLVAALVAGQASQPERPSLAAQREHLAGLCVPVSIRPDAARPVLGFFEPRERDVLTLLASRTDAFLRHSA